MEQGAYKVIEFDIKNKTHRQICLEDMDLTLQGSHVIYWIHYDLSDMSGFGMIAKTLDLPEDAVELCCSDDSMPQLLDSDDKISLQVQCLMSHHRNPDDNDDVENLIVHLSDKYCFTASARALPPVKYFEEYYPKSLRYARTPCFILFLLMDNIINDYAQIIYDYELHTEGLDIRVSNNDDDVYNEVVNTKKQLMKLKRCAVAIREILMRISGRKIMVISDQCRTSLNNLFNQSQFVFYEIDSLRDMLNSLLNQIDYALMYKMNEAMRILAAFAAIFLPLTLITGIYGMNFRWMPELLWQYGYFYALGLLVVCAFILLYVFRKKRWF